MCARVCVCVQESKHPARRNGNFFHPNSQPPFRCAAVAHTRARAHTRTHKHARAHTHTHSVTHLVGGMPPPPPVPAGADTQRAERAGRGLARGTPAPLPVPAGVRLSSSLEVLAGAALTGARALYRWLEEGWVPGGADVPHAGVMSRM
jgi:hypothetical protein